MDPTENPPDNVSRPASDVADDLAFLGEKGLARGTRPPLGYRLYSSWSVGVATFFGSLAAGGLIMAVNYWRLRRWFAALAILAISLAATGGLAVMCVIFTMANDGVRLAGPLAGMGQFFVAGTMTAIADMLQGRALRRHELFAGKLASPWSAFCIALVLTGLTCVAVWQVLHAMHEPLELYEAGFVAARGGDADRADALFSRAIALRPKFGEAYLQRGMLRSQKKQYGPAVEDLDRAVEFLPGQWTALVERGRNKLRLNRNEEAVADLSLAIVQVPMAEAYYLRAIGEFRSGRMREATLDCSLALRLRKPVRISQAACRVLRRLGTARQGRLRSEMRRRPELSLPNLLPVVFLHGACYTVRSKPRSTA